MQDPNEPIWNLSIEDLLVVPPEQLALDIRGPFIVNLLSAATPVVVPPLPGFESLRAYLLSDMEHGRPRYRLRLGFFEKRADAETVLGKLRERFPAAFVSTVREADLRYAPQEMADRVRAIKAEARKAAQAQKTAEAAKQLPAMSTSELDAEIQKHRNDKVAVQEPVAAKPREAFELFPDNHVPPDAIPKVAAPRAAPAPAKSLSSAGKKPAVASPNAAVKRPHKAVPAAKEPIPKNAPTAHSRAPAAPKSHGGAKHAAPPGKPGGTHRGANPVQPLKPVEDTFSLVARDILNDFDKHRFDDLNGIEDVPEAAPASATGKPRPAKAEPVPSQAGAVKASPGRSREHAKKSGKPAKSAGAKPGESVHVEAVAAESDRAVHSVADAVEPPHSVMPVAAVEVGIDDVAAMVPSTATIAPRADELHGSLADDEPTIEALALSDEQLPEGMPAASSPEPTPAETATAATVRVDSPAADFASTSVDVVAPELEPGAELVVAAAGSFILPEGADEPTETDVLAEAALIEAERAAERARIDEAERDEAARVSEAARLESERVAEEARVAEQARLEAERVATAARIAAAARVAEATRLAELERAEAERVAEAARQAEAARVAEAARQAEAARVAEAARQAEAAEAAEAQRAAEAARVAEVAPDAQATSAATDPSPPELDSTQTLRVLTQTELEDTAGSKWFAVQLSGSEEQPNLEMMPQLEIFAEYQLYTVACAVDGKVQHLLRLGFFGYEAGAQAVAAYMKAFFDSPTITRVSLAEHERFSRRKVKDQADETPRAAAGPGSGVTYASAASEREAERRNNGQQNRVSADGRPRRRWTDGAGDRQPGNAKGAREKASHDRAPDSTATSSIWKRLFG